MHTEAAFALLVHLGAAPRLLMHARLVSEAADALLAALPVMNLHLDAELIRAGAILHDAGKVLHPTELDAPAPSTKPMGSDCCSTTASSPGWPAAAALTRSGRTWTSRSRSCWWPCRTSSGRGQERRPGAARHRGHRRAAAAWLLGGLRRGGHAVRGDRRRRRAAAPEELTAPVSAIERQADG